MPARRAPWLLLVALLAPLASAADEPAPTLALEPARIEAPPGANVTAFLVLSNPTSAPLTWALSAEAPSGLRAALASEEVTLAPRSRERVELRVHVPDALNASYVVTVLAQGTRADDATSPPGPMRAELLVHVPPRGPPALRMEVLPALLEVPAGGEARAVLVVRNPGEPLRAPAFELRAPPGLALRFEEAPAALPRGESRHALVVSAAADAPTTAPLAAGVGLGEHRAPFRVRVLPPLPLAQGAAVADAPAPLPLDEDARLAWAAAAAGVGAAWTGLWLTRRHWWPALLALYTRLRPSRMLDHPVRRRIVDLVRETPGVSFSELARRLDIAPGQLTHHARMLEKAGIVFSSPDGQTRRFFHVEHGRLEPVAPLGERALTMLRARPMRAGELARELGVSRQSLHYHVKQLVAQGQLVARADGTLEPAQPAGAAGRLARS